MAINQIFRSDVRLPFGGRKNSGYGVELSLYALKEFTAPKTIIGNFRNFKIKKLQIFGAFILYIG